MKNESKEIAGAGPLNLVFENNSIAFTSLQTKFGEQKELKNCRFYFGLEKKKIIIIMKYQVLQKDFVRSFVVLR